MKAVVLLPEVLTCVGDQTLGTTMHYCGLDLHAKSGANCLVTARRWRVRKGEVPSDAALDSEPEFATVVSPRESESRWFGAPVDPGTT